MQRILDTTGFEAGVSVERERERYTLSDLPIGGGGVSGCENSGKDKISVCRSRSRSRSLSLSLSPPPRLSIALSPHLTTPVLPRLERRPLPVAPPPPPAPPVQPPAFSPGRPPAAAAAGGGAGGRVGAAGPALGGGGGVVGGDPADAVFDGLVADPFILYLIRYYYMIKHIFLILCADVVGWPCCIKLHYSIL
jgi:hypothetical protein